METELQKGDNTALFLEAGLGPMDSASSSSTASETLRDRRHSFPPPRRLFSFAPDSVSFPALSVRDRANALLTCVVRWEKGGGVSLLVIASMPEKSKPDSQRPGADWRGQTLRCLAPSASWP